MPLARTTRGPAQTHRRGGSAAALRGCTHPLTRLCGPRGRRPPVDPRAPAGPHVRRAPVARFRALTPARRHASQSPQHHASPTGERAGAHQCPPPRAGGGLPGPGGGRGNGGAQGAHCRPTRPGGQREGFPQRGRPPGHPRPERSGGPYTAPGDVQPGLISPEAALYGHWMEWRTSNGSGRPLSMGDTLRLTGAGSTMSLHSSAPPLLHVLRTRCPVPEPGAGHIPRRAIQV